MKPGVKNHCVHCGKQLSFFHRLRSQQYCSEAHRDAHLEETNRLALSRLWEAEEKSPSEIRWEQCERRMRVEEMNAELAQQH